MGKKINQAMLVQRLEPHRGPIILTSKEPKAGPLAPVFRNPKTRPEAIRLFNLIFR